ncbi:MULTISPECIES: AlpA family transcriptional regulator [Enterobacterales]|uniref:helix-turn-helix transcriptional regulator n=1 Tax=Enterobacterales TaxID=91347 RepID=UPI002EDA1513
MHASLIRFDEVMRRTGFSRPWIYKLISRGEFPAIVKTGVRSSAFVESEIEAWIQERINKRPSGDGA